VNKIILIILAILLKTSLSFAEIKTNFYQTPSQQKFSSSFYDTLYNPHFYITFGAGLASLILFDGEVSRFASRENPIFGSNENAADWSDSLVIALVPVYIASNFVTEPRYNEKGARLWFKMESLLLTTGILTLNYGIVSIIKNKSGRLRPDDSDLESLPSGHSSISSGMSRLINNNLNNSTYFSPSTSNTIKILSLTTASTIAWARVEAKKHHLSDVLLGHSIGVFVTDFLYNVFIQKQEALHVSFDYTPDQFELNWSFQF
jgi:membrane-associated phospholipid phosphatase